MTVSLVCGLVLGKDIQPVLACQTLGLAIALATADNGHGANPVIHDALSTAQIDVGEFQGREAAAGRCIYVQSSCNFASAAVTLLVSGCICKLQAPIRQRLITRVTSATGPLGRM